MSNPKKDQGASKLGRSGGSKTSKAKAIAAVKNASLPPKPGKRARGRPLNENRFARLMVEKDIVAAFGSKIVFNLGDALKAGNIRQQFTKGRFQMALSALQTKASKARLGSEGSDISKDQDTSIPEASEIVLREFKPEVDAIEAYVKSHRTTKTIAELFIEDLVDLYSGKLNPLIVINEQIVLKPAEGNKPLSEDDAHELCGRMYECIDIKRAIDSGDFKTITDVRNHVIGSAESIDAELKEFKKRTCGFVVINQQQQDSGSNSKNP